MSNSFHRNIVPLIHEYFESIENNVEESRTEDAEENDIQQQREDPKVSRLVHQPKLCLP